MHAARTRQMPTAQSGFLCRHEVLSLYQQLSGRTVDDFVFYRVLSVFSSAIIFLRFSIAIRGTPKRNTNCSEFGALGRQLLDYSFDIAKGPAA